MKTILNAQDILEMITGTCLMGAGGGGSFESGLDMLDAMKAKGEVAVPMVSTKDMDDGSYACVVAGMGSPLKFKARGTSINTEIVSAYESIKRQGFFMGREVKYIMPVEYGALNTLIPMMVAIECGIPFLDADGTGRAVPALETLLFGVNDVDPAPMAMTNHKGDVMMAYPKDMSDAAGMETIGRYLCQAFDMVMGISGWMSNRDQIENKLVPSGNSYAQRVGKAVINARENKLDYTTELKKVIECRELFRGKLDKLEALAKGGFDYGRTHLSGIDSFAGKKCRIDYLNENLVAFVDDQVVMTVPDLICTLNLDTGMPMSNADLAEGMNVLVLVIPAPANWFKNEKGLTCWNRYFEIVGYEGKNVRY